MVGRPRARARREAALLTAGVEPAGFQDDRPMKKPPNRDRGFAKVAAERAPPVGLPGGTPVRVASDDGDFAAILGGFSADDLIGESNAEFEALRQLSFQFAREIMELPLNPSDKHFAKLLQVKTVITQAVFTATTRVRPGDLREKDDDGVGALLAEIRAADGETDEPVETEDEMQARIRREMLG